MFAIDAKDPTPLYAQLERAIRVAMATGRLQVGERLPTVRQLAVDLQINANTVAKVYGELERSGVLETRRGVGTFVRRTGRVVASRRIASGCSLRWRTVSWPGPPRWGSRPMRRSTPQSPWIDMKREQSDG